MSEGNATKEFYAIEENSDGLDGLDVEDVSSGISSGHAKIYKYPWEEKDESTKENVEQLILLRKYLDLQKSFIILKREIESTTNEIKNELSEKSRKNVEEAKKEIESKLLETKNEIIGKDGKGGQLKEIRNSVAESRKQIENQKLTIIETLGIFVALFTFVSVDFQVFKSYRNPFAVAGLSMLLLGAISFLVIIFDFYILQARAIKNDFERNDVSDNSNNDIGFWSDLKKRYRNNPTGIVLRILLFVISISIIILGAFLFCHYSRPENLEDEEQRIKKEISESIKIDIENQNNSLKNINANNSETIEDINNEIDNIKKCVRDFGFTYKCFKEDE